MTPMMHPTPANKPKVSVSGYLDRESAAERSGGRKAEYVNGKVREIPGASGRHNIIGWNIGGLLHGALKGRPFAAYPSDMRVRVAEEGPFYYPDVVVSPVPSDILRHRGETLLNPLVLFEIISSTTETIDPGEKLDNYGRIGSVSDYVVVAQNEVRVDHFSRQADGSWRLVILKDPGQVLSLPSIGVELPLAEIYERVFPEQEGAAP